MTTFNKILNPMYSAIAAYSKQEDGSINAKYVLGTGEDSDGSVTNFTPIISDYKWIDAVAAKELMKKPLTKEDIGKTTEQIDLERIYAYLKENGQIVISSTLTKINRTLSNHRAVFYWSKNGKH